MKDRLKKRVRAGAGFCGTRTGGYLRRQVLPGKRRRGATRSGVSLMEKSVNGEEV